MTLSNYLIVGLLSLATAAQAYVVPPRSGSGDSYGPIGGIGPDYGPQPGYGPEPGYPGNPGHPGYPGHPNQPGHPAQPYPDQGAHFQKEARVHRLIRGEVLNLRRLADIDMNFRDFRVQSVSVQMRPSRYGNANLQLLVRNRVEDERSVYNENYIVLYPRGFSELGTDTNSLRLRVNGEIYIDRIIVDLVRDGYPGGGGHQPNPPAYGEQIVQLPLPGYMAPSSRLDLTPYIDVNRYRGMTLVGVEITANARHNAALLDVLVNSFNEGTLTLNRYSSAQRVNLRQRLVLGSSFGSLVLLPRGDSNIRSVRLILRR